MSVRVRAGILSVILALTGACSEAPSGDAPQTSQVSSQTVGVSGADLLNAAQNPQEWLTYGGTYDEQRFSRLTQINTDNAAQLGAAWTYDLSTGRGVESTPIVVDGVMYVTSAWSVVHALNAATGEELWVYDPDVDRSMGVQACCDVVNRGVAVWGNKVYVGVIDGRLEALNAKTGERVWSKVTVDQSMPYTITGAPRVVDGKVLIGNGGADLGVRGYLSAYDAETGDKIWRFYTVPNPNKQPDGEISDAAFRDIGNVTWGDKGDWLTDGGGGTVWDSIIYDAVNDAVIFGTGNGSPWNQNFRDPSGGDNLFLSSIMSVDADTGAYRWHYQTTPGDNWDYTATQTLILADLPLGENGANRRVVMQAPKNGFFYVLDAEDGELISGKAYVPQNWTTGLDEAGRPVENPAARYGKEPFLQVPGPMGGHNWHPMAYSPDTGLVYIPAQEVPQIYAEDPYFRSKRANWNIGIDVTAGLQPVLPKGTIPFLKSAIKGRLLAWDPVAQEPRWAVEHKGAWNGGILTTAGNLVFQGTLDGEFAAYNAKTGEKLWSQDVKSGAASGPGTYEIDGTQYVTITTGWGSAYALTAGYAYDKKVPPSVGKVVTFKIGGAEKIEAPDLFVVERVPAAEPFGDDVMQREGMTHYARFCMACHGPMAISSGVLPDLRWSAYAGDAEAWRDVVINGTLSDAGMVSFGDALTAEDVEAIRAYVLLQAHNPSDE